MAVPDQVPGQVPGPASPGEVTIRRASTVLLVRDAAAGGVEVFVQHRTAGMAFAAGVVAFPGGGVDPRDAADIGWAGPGRQWWSTRLGVAGDIAGTLVVAAVRELFEETGVLLAASSRTTPPDGGVTGEREANRQAVADHRIGLAAALAAENLVLRSDLLRPWANWVTPPGRARRYDTFFFLAALPAAQQARSVTTEADAGEWARPQEVLRANAEGTLRIMPPTKVQLIGLAGATSTAELLASDRIVRPVAPRVVSAPGEPVVVEVDGMLLDVPDQPPAEPGVQP